MDKTITVVDRNNNQYEVFVITCLACGSEFESDNEDDLVLQLCGCQDDDCSGYGRRYSDDGY